MADRTKRLREALPDVTKAVRNQKVFHDEANTVWTHLRRGLTDLKKEPEKLDSLELPSDSTIDDVWEFMLDLMVDHPKYSRQILDAVDFLLCSERWGEGFLQAKQKHRLSLWKLKGKKDQEPSPVSLTIHLLQNGVAVDELLPLTALDNGSAFVEELASELKGDLRRQLEESELGAALREAREAKCASPLPEGNSVEDP
ncbi:unnamed protein product [Effrenium voratum]|nr:unnamed protein product [Effrenium voratum]